MEERFEFGEQQVTVRIGGAGVPLIYLPTPEGDGADVWESCQALGCPPFTLVTITVPLWDDDLSPWPCPPLTRSDVESAGKGADELALLRDTIMPAVETDASASPSFRVIAGYSLGGLFALWSLYQTDCFSRAVSASGSLWFPEFLEYARAHTFARTPERVYLSLGSKEHKTPNRLLRTVKDRTQEFADLLAARGVEQVFETNPGNHFKDEALRTAKGIAWILR